MAFDITQYDFEEGDDWEKDGDSCPGAGISVGPHGKDYWIDRIEVHADTRAEAMELRDLVIRGLQLAKAEAEASKAADMCSRGGM